jgi:hypothetical protein
LPSHLDLTIATFSPCRCRWPGRAFPDPGATHRFFQQALDEVRRVPGVVAAAVTHATPAEAATPTSMGCNSSRVARQRLATRRCQRSGMRSPLATSTRCGFRSAVADCSPTRIARAVRWRW